MARIIRFMQSPPLPYPPGTTRNMVSRLTRDGEIRRVGIARYRGDSAGADALEQIGPD